MSKAEEMKYLSRIHLRETLFQLREDEYRDFSRNLLPGIYNILGVRIPKLRKLAKDIIRKDWKYFISINQNEYFEEIMLEGLIIGYLTMDFHELEPLITAFIPKINNWSICDTFSSNLKITNLYKDEIWGFIQQYFKSNEPYDLRFAIVMVLNYFIEDEYIENIFNIFKNIKSEHYYVEMAVGWAISYCYIDYPDQTLDFLENDYLNKSKHNISIQKIIESTRVNREDKKLIRKLRR